MRSQTLVLAAFLVLVAIGIAWLMRASRSASEGAVPGPRETRVVRTAETVDAPEGLASSTDLREAATPTELASSEPERTQLVRVLDAETKLPLPGAFVRTFADSVAGEHVTNERGECRVVPKKGESLQLAVGRGGYFHVHGQWASDPITIEMQPAARLEGRLLDAANDDPLPGARISVLHGLCRCKPDIAAAGPGGRYALAMVPLRTQVTIRLSAEGFTDQNRTIEVRGDGPLVEADFRLERGFEIHGTVVDWDTGLVVPGARVENVPCDERGRFAARALLSTERVHLDVDAKGYCTHEWSAPVEEVEGREVVVRLPRSAVVEGFVRSAEGVPVEGASLRFRNDHFRRAKRGPDDPPPVSPLDGVSDSFRPADGSVSARTDATGYYVVPDAVPWSSDWFVQIGADGYETAKEAIDVMPGAGERARRDFVLTPTMQPTTARVHGVVTVNGSPAAGRVTWTGPTRSGEGSIYEGQYSDEVEPGRVTLKFAVHSETEPGAASLAEVVAVVEAAAGDELRKDVEVRMPTAWIRGRVLYAPDEPIPDASVTAFYPLTPSGVFSDSPLRFSGVSDESGSFSIEVPDLSGPFWLQAVVENEVHQLQDIFAGDEDLELIFPRLSTLLLRVRAKDSERPLRFDGYGSILWSPAGQEDWEGASITRTMTQDQDGWYELELPSGVLDLRVLPPKEENLRRTSIDGVVVRPAGAEPTRVDVELEPGIELTLRLADGFEQLPEEHLVVLVEERLWADLERRPGNSWSAPGLGTEVWTRCVSFRAERTWSVRRLAPELFRFKAFPSDIAIEPRTIDLSDGKARTVEIGWGELR